MRSSSRVGESSCITSRSDAAMRANFLQALGHFVLSKSKRRPGDFLTERPATLYIHQMDFRLGWVANGQVPVRARACFRFGETPNAGRRALRYHRSVSQGPWLSRREIDMASWQFFTSVSISVATVSLERLGRKPPPFRVTTG